jgi:hypothetical protein
MAVVLGFKAGEGLASGLASVHCPPCLQAWLGHMGGGMGSISTVSPCGAAAEHLAGKRAGSGPSAGRRHAGWGVVRTASSIHWSAGDGGMNGWLLRWSYRRIGGTNPVGGPPGEPPGEAKVAQDSCICALRKPEKQIHRPPRPPDACALLGRTSDSAGAAGGQRPAAGPGAAPGEAAGHSDPRIGARWRSGGGAGQKGPSGGGWTAVERGAGGRGAELRGSGCRRDRAAAV